MKGIWIGFLIFSYFVSSFVMGRVRGIEFEGLGGYIWSRVYNGEGEIVGYINIRYGGGGVWVEEEELYDGDQKLIERRKMTYKRGELKFREIYNGEGELLEREEIKYKRSERKGLEIERTVNLGGGRKRRTVIEEEYNRWGGKEERREYVIDGGRLRYRRRLEYQYEGGNKRVNIFIQRGRRERGFKEGFNEEFKEGRVYKSKEGRMDEILILDKYRRAKKYIKYYYEMERVKKINIYKVKGYDFEWHGGFGNFPTSCLELKYSFRYEYE